MEDAEEVNVATKAKGEKLADTIFARIDGEGENAMLLAYVDEGEAVDDDIKTGEVVEVGVYKLERIKKVRKVIEEV